MRASGKKVSPYKIISVYGYGYFIYIIACLILVIPHNVRFFPVTFALDSPDNHVNLCSGDQHFTTDHKYSKVPTNLLVNFEMKCREMHNETSTKILVTV
jgi:hypothetical protein